jgi:hypothetical protein
MRRPLFAGFSSLVPGDLTDPNQTGSKRAVAFRGGNSCEAPFPLTPKHDLLKVTMIGHAVCYKRPEMRLFLALEAIRNSG